MRGRDKTHAPLDETLDAREPGALLLGAGALQSDADVDDAEPRVVHVGGGGAEDDDKPVVDEAKAVAEMALTVPETDPERVAYAMWNEGRADEAIELLERHLAAERDRRRETALVPVSATGSDAARIEPASDWRERHQAALSPAEFNAFGASAHTIDITPTPADAIVPHSVRGSLRTGWLIGVSLVVLSISAAAAYFVTRDGDIATILTAAEPVADAEPATAAVTEPKLAAVEPDVDGADAPPPDETPVDTEVADISPSADEIVEVPPPEEDAPVGDVASTPPEEDATSDDVASIAPEENAPRDDVASAPPVDASLLPAPSNAESTDTFAADVSAPGAAAPETTASIEPASEAAESAPIVEARLPRQRPEPPASFIERASAPQVAALEEPDISAPDSPLIVSEPPPTEAEIASVEPEVPVYGPDGPVRVYRHIRRMPYPPVPGRAFPRRTLTPAEYRALVERRAWAERYTAERRTGIVGRILTRP